MESDPFYQEGPPQPPSIYGETLRSRDYGDKRVYPDLSQLREIGNYWAIRQNDPEVSRRGAEEIERILGRITFEIVSREREQA